jgi:hypothetical protein
MLYSALPPHRTCSRVQVRSLYESSMQAEAFVQLIKVFTSRIRVAAWEGGS